MAQARESAGEPEKNERKKKKKKILQPFHIKNKNVSV